MYSGENDEYEETTPFVPPVLPDRNEAEFLAKLKSLRVNCDELHITLKTALVTSGVCKKYTNPGFHESLRSSPNVSRYSSRYLYQIGGNSESDEQKPDNSAVKLPSKPFPTVESETEPSRKPPSNIDSEAESSKNFDSPKKRLPASRLLSALQIEKRQRQLRKFYQRKKELSLKPHLVPLRLKHGNGKGLSRKNGTTTSKLTNRGRHKMHIWVPQQTIPEPFIFTLREAEAPIRANYAKKFLNEMLAEKIRKETADRAEHRKQFRAKPPPRTTYISDSNFFIRQIRKPRTKSAPAGLKLRALSEPALDNLSRNTSGFKAKPVPITTYIRPSTIADELRAATKTQRAVEMLLNSRAPFCIADHVTRTHVQNNIRHKRRCYDVIPSFMPSITKSVPDFRMLQMEFTNKMIEARERRPPTMTVPFQFRQDTVARHSCANMKKQPTKINENWTNNRSTKSSDTFSVQ